VTVTERLAELGISLPEVFPPAGNYVGCVVDGDVVFVGDHGPVAGSQVVVGKVGGDLSSWSRCSKTRAGTLDPRWALPTCRSGSRRRSS